MRKYKEAVGYFRSVVKMAQYYGRGSGLRNDIEQYRSQIASIRAKANACNDAKLAPYSIAVSNSKTMEECIAALGSLIGAAHTQEGAAGSFGSEASRKYAELYNAAGELKTRMIEGSTGLGTGVVGPAAKTNKSQSYQNIREFQESYNKFVDEDTDHMLNLSHIATDGKFGPETNRAIAKMKEIYQETPDLEHPMYAAFDPDNFASIIIKPLSGTGVDSKEYVAKYPKINTYPSGYEEILGQPADTEGTPGKKQPFRPRTQTTKSDTDYFRDVGRSPR